MLKTKFDSLSNHLLLIAATIVLYYLLILTTTDQEFSQIYFEGQWTLQDYVTEVVSCLVMSIVFVEVSIYYSYRLFHYISFAKKPYRGLLIHTTLLLLLNNLTAWAFSLVTEMMFAAEIPLFHQERYIFSVLITFISGIYTNAQYVEMHIRSLKQEDRLKTALRKEKEIRIQRQLDLLKTQISPHFMFNNFSILSELIAENPDVAGEFLNHLSKVYRYIIQNLKRNTVALRDEIGFLHSYIYLIKMRYEKAVSIELAGQLGDMDGEIPPACLQMLVENAIKHNRVSEKEPLHIHIFSQEDWLVVTNELRPLDGSLPPSGIGWKNITERYALLCDEKPVAEKKANMYIAKIPILL